jgi:hypothetical protein
MVKFHDCDPEVYESVLAHLLPELRAETARAIQSAYKEGRLTITRCDNPEALRLSWFNGLRTVKLIVKAGPLN